MSEYELDFYQWTQRQSAMLRSRQVEHLDWDHLAEELESMGKRERRELSNRLGILLAHLLKWRYQPERRSASWQATIAVQRQDIEELLEDNPSLKSYLLEGFERGYRKGRLLAIAETHLPPSTFPSEPPFTLQEALDTEFNL
ncbi:MAG: DUF29 domain-containing protein [Phormidium sp. BM_Day4_Bin.17]|nr:DUF29 domain-containing protein [Phormidium sp. BM_Day4_Bin.17]UCJ10692.1 MAG: DUF29 family protein [Phormidium sp. PBR-2020]